MLSGMNMLPAAHDVPEPNDRELEAIIAARRAAESAICLAMVTSAVPGLGCIPSDSRSTLPRQKSAYREEGRP
jgi:hypothetical protein